MAENRVKNEDEENGNSSGGGNKNALAYGLLQGAGYNTNGMSPSDAWALVDALKLLDREQNKKTDEEKSDYKKKNAEAKEKGVTKDSVVQSAGNVAEHVAIHTNNTAGAKTAVDTVQELQKEYGLNKLDRIQTKRHVGKGLFSAAASANGKGLNIHAGFLNNPSAFYRNAVEDYQKSAQAKVERWEEVLKGNLTLNAKMKAEKNLESAREEAKYSRHNVCYKGEEVKSVITHEMGHCIADQLCGQINGKACLKQGINENTAKRKVDLIRNTYTDACKSGEITKISAYGATNEHEFFAEAFTMYKMGKEKLPEKIEKMIVEVLK